MVTLNWNMLKVTMICILIKRVFEIMLKFVVFFLLPWSNT